VSREYESALQLHREGRLDAAADAYRFVLAKTPDSVGAHFNLGAVLHVQGQVDEAEKHYARAIELRQDYAAAHDNLGNIYHDRGQLSEAIESYRRAIQSDPRHASAWNNLGMGLKELASYGEAAQCFGKAIEIEASFADAHWNAGILALLEGNFEAGWRGYEWRWKVYPTQAREFWQPRWKGEPLAGKTILLHAEQGLGDTIQFVRYALLVQEQNVDGTVVVECQRPLVNLLARCSNIGRIMAKGDEVPEFDFEAPLLSLPDILRTRLESISAPYLFADAALVGHWRKALSGVRGFRVGINWRGRADKTESQKRDVPLELLASLAARPGVQLISLQRGAGQEDLKAVSGRLPIIDLGEFDTEHGAFMDTAAIMKNVDLVISSDTAVPHLAGALGVPVWVALPFVPDWRWLLERSDSPWYPTMRLFRQKRAGDWAGVFEEIREALRELVG
jgi:tetratricopeptide (TPR) repeat protein